MNPLTQHPNQRKAVTVQDMEDRRDVITNLFETHTLLEVKEIMARDHKFFATAAQYKKRKTAWKIGPNIRKEKMVQMLRTIDRRRARGKHTIYRFHGQVVTREKLERGRKRFKEELTEVTRSPSPPNSPVISEIECMTPRPTSPEMDISSPLIDSVVAESTTLSTDPLSTSTESQPSLIGNAPNPSSQLLCTSNTDPENPFYPQLSAESTASDMIVRPSGTMFHEDGVITIPQNAVKLQNPRRHVIYDGQGLRQDRSRSRDIFSSGVGYNASIPVDPPPAHGGDKDPRLLLDGIRQSPDVTQKQTRRRYLPARIGISTISYNPTCDANGAPLYETFHSMGIRYSSMMYYENAREYFYKALAKIESTERTCGSHTNLRLKCACLINLSSMYMNKRNHEKARELTELALDGFKVTIKETDLKLFATAQMGSISLSVGDYETALKYLNEALHGYRMFFWDDIYSDGPIAMLLEWLGKIYYIQGNFDRALELYRHIAWRYKRSICSCTPRRLRGILENGEICEEMKDNETALLFYELALVGWGLLQDPSLENHPDKLWTLHNLGTFYRKQGDYEKALDYSTQVVEGLRLNDDRANQGFGYTPESYLGEFCYSSSASIDDETPLMND